MIKQNIITAYLYRMKLWLRSYFFDCVNFISEKSEIAFIFMWFI